MEYIKELVESELFFISLLHQNSQYFSSNRKNSQNVNPWLQHDTIIDRSRFNLWRRINNFKRMPKWLEFIKYLVGVPTNVDSEVLAIIKDNENVSELFQCIFILKKSGRNTKFSDWLWLWDRSLASARNRQASSLCLLFYSR